MAEARAQALAATSKTASTGPIWFNLGGMMANGPELRRAREIQCSKWQDVEDATREKEENAETMKERIASCNQPWHSYLAPIAVMMGKAESDEDSVVNESAPEDPNDQSEAPLDPKRLAHSATIYRQMLAIDSDAVEMGLMCPDNFKNDEDKELEDYIEYAEELLAEANEKYRAYVFMLILAYFHCNYTITSSSSQNNP